MLPKIATASPERQESSDVRLFIVLLRRPARLILPVREIFHRYLGQGESIVQIARGLTDPSRGTANSPRNVSACASEPSLAVTAAAIASRPSWPIRANSLQA
jgi:hypothetical protein